MTAGPEAEWQQVIKEEIQTEKLGDRGDTHPRYESHLKQWSRTRNTEKGNEWRAQALEWGTVLTTMSSKGPGMKEPEKHSSETGSQVFFSFLYSSLTLLPRIYVALASDTYFPNHRGTAKDLPFCSRIFSLCTEDFNKCASLEKKSRVFKALMDCWRGENTLHIGRSQRPRHLSGRQTSDEITSLLVLQASDIGLALGHLGLKFQGSYFSNTINIKCVTQTLYVELISLNVNRTP